MVVLYLFFVFIRILVSKFQTFIFIDTVAGNDSKDLRDEHKLEEEPDQLSEVKSDHNVDSGIELHLNFTQTLC